MKSRVPPSLPVKPKTGPKPKSLPAVKQTKPKAPGKPGKSSRNARRNQSPAKKVAPVQQAPDNVKGKQPMPGQELPPLVAAAAKTVNKKPAAPKCTRANKKAGAIASSALDHNQKLQGDLDALREQLVKEDEEEISRIPELAMNFSKLHKQNCVDPPKKWRIAIDANLTMVSKPCHTCRMAFVRAHKTEKEQMKTIVTPEYQDMKVNSETAKATGWLSTIAALTVNQTVGALLAANQARKATKEAMRGQGVGFGAFLTVENKTITAVKYHCPLEIEFRGGMGWYNRMMIERGYTSLESFGDLLLLPKVAEESFDESEWIISPNGIVTRVDNTPTLAERMRNTRQTAREKLSDIASCVVGTGEDAMACVQITEEQMDTARWEKDMVLEPSVKVTAAIYKERIAAKLCVPVEEPARVVPSVDYSNSSWLYEKSKFSEDTESVKPVPLSKASGSWGSDPRAKSNSASFTSFDPQGLEEELLWHEHSSDLSGSESDSESEWIGLQAKQIDPMVGGSAIRESDSEAGSEAWDMDDLFYADSSESDVTPLTHTEIFRREYAKKIQEAGIDRKISVEAMRYFEQGFAADLNGVVKTEPEYHVSPQLTTHDVPWVGSRVNTLINGKAHGKYAQKVAEASDVIFAAAQLQLNLTMVSPEHFALIKERVANHSVQVSPASALHLIEGYAAKLVLNARQLEELRFAVSPA